MAHAITIDGISKHYPSLDAKGQQTKAVDDISLQIEPGELFFLLGPSGCGKTTLLRMMAGFIEPTNGRILFGNRDVTTLPPNKRQTGMVFQSYALWPHMSVAENVAFGLNVQKVAKAEQKSRVEETLRLVQMDAYAERKPTQLSGGQQQRVALARALVVRPDVLLLDEPLSNLDAKLRIEMRSEIRRICKEAGITGVYVTHDQKEALSMADRIAVLHSGRVAQVGTPQELYRRPTSRFVADFLGETNFIAGERASTNESVCEVKTAVGLVHSSVELDQDFKQVICSVRPESWSFTSELGQNTFEGTITQSVYLGEIAQHTIRLADGQETVISDLHPTTANRAGDQVYIHVKPQDVVLLPSS